MYSHRVRACVWVVAGAILLSLSGCSNSGGGGGECSGCHGGSRNAAPPRDTQGNRDTSLVTVGAHQTHLGKSRKYRRILCEDCHLVPDDEDDPQHMDGGPAELTWSTLARSDGANPIFDRSAATCSGVYCHGSTLPSGGTNTRPIWTTVDGSQNACGTCHGLPPEAPHPESYACGTCHGMVVDNLLRFVDPSLHINGTINISDTSCSNCHGSVASSAPPVDTQGRNSSRHITVGAHQAHLRSSDWHAALVCTDCHLVPMTIDDPGHLDPSPAELTWGPLAETDGATPAFDRTSESCSNVYCHGATLIAGGTNTSPTWTTANGTEAACGTCHGLPPAAPHPTSTACQNCHGMVVDGNLSFIDASLHINGVVNVSTLSCSSCHGSIANSAPPLDTFGQNATTEVTIGAHQAHLGTSTWHREVLCDDCHVVPAASDDPGHLDTAPAELTWGAIAQVDGATPDFDRTSATCSGVYCHGTTLISGNGTNTQPTWTTVDGTEASCGTCHGLPPGGSHPSSSACSVCHGMVVDDNRNFVDATLHINGVVNVSAASCSDCHGSATNSAPPVDTQGLAVTTEVTVGAHQAHLGSSTWHHEVLCADCHVVPTAVDNPGHLDAAPAELTWSALARSDGATPVFDRTSATCNGVYCHGTTLSFGGGSNTQPNWTTVDGTEAACGSCHGLPPPGPHPNSTACSVCHGMVVDDSRNFVDASLHINGIVNVSSANCSDCHGSATNSAPPVDTQGLSATTEVTVGAHQAHLGASTWHREMLCADCHVVPTVVESPGHLDTAPAELIWGTLAQADGATPAFDRTSATCSGVYCHGETLSSGTNTQPDWTTVNGTQATCGTCHGLPPAAPHPNSTACSTCHGMVVDDSRNFVDPSLHINGVVNVSGVSCTECHGNATNSAPPVDTQGLSATTEVTVGAHQQHLGTSTWHREMLCTDCHVVPANVGDPGHLDTAPADLTWGAVSQADGASPSFDRGGATCSGVYCHGSTLSGGTTTTPFWTTVDGTQTVCGSCHGLPPDPPHPVDADCGSCHGEVHDGVNFVDATLHIDGTVQAIGACDSCHGNPPAPGNESYAGSGGAHATHVVTLGYACAVCHGHDGSGPRHNEANGTVLQTNVDIVFDATVTFPGGTTMSNGLSSSESYNAGNPTCYVGCHNPIPGDSTDLNNPAIWTDTTIGCHECHDRPGVQLPENHDIQGDDATIDANCQTCHDTATHRSGTMIFNDPDASDGFSYALQGTNGLCRTCHDGGAGSFFGGQSADDVSDFWNLPAAHEQAGNDCLTCHGYHGSTGSGDLAASDEEDLCLSCHDGQTASTDLDTVFQSASHHPVDDAEQGSFSIECIDCHDPHADTNVAPYVADPDPDDSFVPAGIDTNYCLTCHDGEQAPDKTAYLAGAHHAAGITCAGDCHVTSAGVDGNALAPFGPHGSEYPELTSFFEEAMCGNCHPETLEMSAAGTMTHHHVVDSEQTASAPLECVTCHDPHVVKDSPWQPLTDPDTGALVSTTDVPADQSENSAAAANDTGRFCLDCHDGSWPDAINIAAELSNERTINSGFYKGTKNLHREHRDEPNGRSGQMACNYCHNTHGNTGTSGIQRGSLLYDWINVTRYPYTGKGSCGTGDVGNRCH